MEVAWVILVSGYFHNNYHYVNFLVLVNCDFNAPKQVALQRRCGES